ncbi:MAG: LuxR C-terminal-related transcriptional regulator [Myxococcota bacterium]
MPTVESALERARRCFANRAWADAREAFRAADQEAALAAEDVERLAWCGGLLARDDELFSGLERAYDLYLDAGLGERAALCAFWHGTRLSSLGEVGRGGAWLARANAFVESEGQSSVVRGYLLLPAAHRQMAAQDFAQAALTATHAADWGKRFADSNLEALAQSILGRILLRQGEVERGLELLDCSMLTASAASIMPNVTGVVYCAAISSCNRVFALDRAREWTRLLSDFCEAQPQLVTFSGTCLVHCSEVHQVCGDWSAAIRDAERACERVPPTPAYGMGSLADALYQRAELTRLRGEFDAAEELYRAANDLGREPQPGLALLRLAQGKIDLALQAIRRVLVARTEPGERLPILPAAVEIFLAAKEFEEARARVLELEQAAPRFPSEIVRAMASHAEGALHLAEGTPEAALAPLRKAFEIWQRTGALYPAARVRVDLGKVYQALGDIEGAELEFAAARTVFERLGARNDLAKLTPTPSTTPTTPGGLTARELEVLRLVASGKTNKLIANDLGLSEKTVDRHVSNIFTKIQVTSRAAATAYAFKHGLV